MSNFDDIKNTPPESENLPAEVEITPSVEKPGKPKFNWRTNRKLRLGATATAITIVVVAVVVIINIICGILADRFPWTLDLTADQTYSLSEESRNVAKSVTKKVEIVVLAGEEYFSAPNTGREDFDTIYRQFYLFSKEYENLSGGNVTTAYVDLEKNPTLSPSYEEKYEATSGNILFVCGEQYRMISLNDLLDVDDSNYYSPTISSLVEQKLATNISSVCGGKTVTVTFLTGHGESEDSIAALKRLYELNGYFTQTLDFTTAQAISDTTGAIAIVGPTKDYSVDEIKRLREWLNNDGNLGRNLFVFANFAGTCPNLYDFLSVDYGITVTSNIIMETDANNYPINYYGGYLPLNTVISTNLTTTSANKKVVMPFTLQLLTSKNADTEKLTNHTLVSFPESSRLTPFTASSSETSNEEVTQLEADTYPVIGMAYAYDYDMVNNKTVQNYVVVSGSYLFADADYLSSTLYENQNESLAIDPLRTMCPLGNTVSVSSKDLSANTVSFSSLTATVLDRVFTVGVPLVLIVICLVVFFKRRHL